jgi:hypothetical protein
MDKGSAKMQRYAVMIEVDDELMYVSADNPFNYNRSPKAVGVRKKPSNQRKSLVIPMRIFQLLTLL